MEESDIRKFAIITTGIVLVVAAIMSSVLTGSMDSIWVLLSAPFKFVYYSVILLTIGWSPIVLGILTAIYYIVAGADRKVETASSAALKVGAFLFFAIALISNTSSSSSSETELWKQFEPLLALRFIFNSTTLIVLFSSAYDLRRGLKTPAEKKLKLGIAFLVLGWILNLTVFAPEEEEESDQGFQQIAPELSPRSSSDTFQSSSDHRAKEILDQARVDKTTWVRNETLLITRIQRIGNDIILVNLSNRIALSSVTSSLKLRFAADGVKVLKSSKDNQVALELPSGVELSDLEITHTPIEEHSVEIDLEPHLAELAAKGKQCKSGNYESCAEVIRFLRSTKNHDRAEYWFERYCQKTTESGVLKFCPEDLSS